MIFIVGVLGITIVGLVHPLALHAAPLGHPTAATHGLEAVGVLLVLQAFAAGCSALTGVEAIANGVPLFRAPRQVRAKRTEAMLGLILGAMLLGLATLEARFHIAPKAGRPPSARSWGKPSAGIAYYVVSLAITLALALAANTSFGGLPVLTSLLARDHYLPHLFSLRGDRQIYSNGSWPWRCSQPPSSGGERQHPTPDPDVRHRGFHRLHAVPDRARGPLEPDTPPHWRRRATINALGAAVTGVSTVIFLITNSQPADGS